MSQHGTEMAINPAIEACVAKYLSNGDQYGHGDMGRNMSPKIMVDLAREICVRSCHGNGERCKN